MALIADTRRLELLQGRLTRGFVRSRKIEEIGGRLCLKLQPEGAAPNLREGLAPIVGLIRVVDEDSIPRLARPRNRKVHEGAIVGHRWNVTHVTSKSFGAQQMAGQQEEQPEVKDTSGRNSLTLQRGEVHHSGRSS